MKVAWDIDGVLYPFVDILIEKYNEELAFDGNKINDQVKIAEIYKESYLPYEIEKWDFIKHKEILNEILKNPRKYGLYTDESCCWDDDTFLENVDYLITSRNSYNGIGSDTLKWINYYLNSEGLPQVIIANDRVWSHKGKMCDLFEIEVLIEDDIYTLYSALENSSTLLFGIIFDRPWNRKLFVNNERGEKKEIEIPKNIRRVYSLKQILDLGIF